MSLLEEILVGRKLPFSDDYQSNLEKIKYLRLSYVPNGVDYTQGKASDGSKIIHKMECEEGNDWEIRTSQTPVRHYVSNIISKYNAAVFRNEPTRNFDGQMESFLEDADNYGTPLNELMRKSLLDAQIDGAAYLLADSTVSDTEILTISQKMNAGARPFIRRLKVENIANIEKIDNYIVAAVVLLVDEDGKVFGRYMDSRVYIDMELDQKKYYVRSMGEEYSHGYDAIPLVEILPFELPQSQMPADSQRTIVNILSLLQQEIVDHTFTKHILSGVRINQDGEENQKISYGSKRLIVLEDPSAKIETIGSDVTQSDSLRKQIEIEETNMYYSAGFGRPNIEPTALSGVSRLIALEDFFINCNALKTAIEKAENQILQVIVSKEGGSADLTAYVSKFVADDAGEELMKVRDILAMNLPKEFHKMVVLEYINRFYNVSDEKLKLMEQELMDGDQSVVTPRN